MAWEYRTSFEAIEMKLDLKQHDLIKLIWKEMKASRFKLLRVRTRGRSVKHEAVRRDEKDRFKYSRKKQSVTIQSLSRNMNLNLFSEIPDEIDINFPTSYPQITERINQINPVQYSKTRNFINGAVTYLSPYISRGAISVKQVIEAVWQKGYKPDQIEKFLQELAWREYFQRVWQHTGDEIWNDIRYPQPGVQHHQMINAVEHAETGIDLIDKQIKKLYHIGYMHNHVRMYTASIVCNMANAHWLQPSKWMYYHLLDGDIASNNCSWQWVAAAFASKKYYFNQENVNKYSFGKQQNTFIDKPYEEIISMPVPDILKPTHDVALQTTLPVTKIPGLDINKPTLIYNSYNLDVKWRKNEDVNRILLLEPSHFEKYPVSEKVIQFVIDLSKNIEGIQIYTGEIYDLNFENGLVVSKEHPLFTYYPGIKDNRDWIFSDVTGYYNSFFSFWKKCEQILK
jgi:deoxyribodipyrimidine photo-lyase